MRNTLILGAVAALMFVAPPASAGNVPCPAHETVCPKGQLAAPRCPHGYKLALKGHRCVIHRPPR